MLTCPKCRTSLPRCSLCLLSMGCINPSMQLQHEMSQRRHLAGGTKPEGVDEASDRNAMPFADWWTWCQGCQHGGHATHLSEVRGARPLRVCLCCELSLCVCVFAVVLNPQHLPRGTVHVPLHRSGCHRAVACLPLCV